MIFCRDRGFLKDLKQKGNQTFFVFFGTSHKIFDFLWRIGPKMEYEKVHVYMYATRS